MLAGSFHGFQGLAARLAGFLRSHTGAAFKQSSGLLGRRLCELDISGNGGTVEEPGAPKRDLGSTNLGSLVGSSRTLMVVVQKL